MASKSLGVLTLDIVAQVGGFVAGMDKAERQSLKWRKQVEQDMKAAGTAIGAGVAAGAAALTALTAATIQTAGEISRFAQVSGIGVEEFQRYAAGARAVGIEQEKLGDIFKDVQDKVGDFVATGGGELKNFFDYIAPQVGVTAEQFRKLSGPQALELYVSSLEKAGVSQNEMIFYLESIADDASLLLPLLRNNAEGFRLFGDAASQAGAILSADTIRASQEFSATLELAGLALDGMSNQITSAMLPVLSDLASEFYNASKDGADLTDVAETITSVIKTASAIAVGGAGAFQLLGKSLEGVAAMVAAIPDGFDAIGAARKAAQEDLEATAKATGESINRILAAGGEGGTNEAVKRLVDIRAEREKLAAANRALTSQQVEDAKKAKDAAESAAKAIQSQIAALELQAKTVGMTAEQQTLYKLELDGATKAQLSQAKAALDVVEAFEKQKAYKQLVAELRTDEEQLTDQMRERLKVLDAMQGLSTDERSRVAGRIAGAVTTDAPEFGGLAPEVGGAFGELAKLGEAEEKLAEWYSTQLEMLEQFRKERADLSATWDEEELAVKEQHEAALLQIEQARQAAQLSAAESIAGDLVDVARQFAGEQSAIYKIAFAAQKAAAIAQSLVAIQTGIAMAAANPFPANLAAMATVAAATASIIGNISSIGIAGQAHDGIMSIPEDGTWNLKKGERVTTAETSAKLDRTLEDVQRNRQSGGGDVNVTLIEDAKRAGQVTQNTDPDGRRTVQIVVASIMGDEAVQKAISQKFGLPTRGT
ncbi:phage tail tape measure protein [Azotobacter salinestris]|uniref:phage tail tape measure protein n=1 Tax=Azotobacter salinestris TaxID=69964 RepID=UPI0032DFD804